MMTGISVEQTKFKVKSEYFFNFESAFIEVPRMYSIKYPSFYYTTLKDQIDPFSNKVKLEINQNAKENQSNQSKSKSEIY
jgi:hypothetical protein